MGFMWKNRNADSLITREMGFLQEDKLNTLTIPLNSECKKNIICYNNYVKVACLGDWQEQEITTVHFSG